MLEVSSVEDVFACIEKEFSSYNIGTEVVDLFYISGRIAAEDIHADSDVPSFTKSSVDGYAVFSADTTGASESLPVELIKGTPVVMGKKPGNSLVKGSAVYIPTGGEIPQGADAVVMIEDTTDFGDTHIYINAGGAPGNNLIFRGDDVKSGEIIVTRGTVLLPQHAALMASLGICKVKVKKRLGVAVISTGDEIIPPETAISGAEVRDANSYYLCNALAESGVNYTFYGIVADSFDEISKVTEKALAENDMVLISGGSSAGMKDETARVINALGVPGVLIHGIAIKPGKPTIIGKNYNKPIIGLPGHPAAVIIIYKMFIQKIINTLYGIRERPESGVDALLTENYPSNNGRDEIIPVLLESRNAGSITGGEPLYLAHPLKGKSVQIKNMTIVQGYIHKKRSLEGLAAGEKVRVIFL